MSQTELTLFTIAVTLLWMVVAGGAYLVFLWWRKKDRPRRP